MKCGMFTLAKSDIGMFADEIPQYVLENCDKKGTFLLGAADGDSNLLGFTQFFVGVLESGEIIADIVYVFVNEDYRQQGVASKMLNKVHNILKKSNVKKSLVFLKKKQNEKELFSKNSYVFMKPEAEPVNALEDLYEKMIPAKMEQGVSWTDR
jgi:GNAT superfamily N-acetyltransferase